MNVGRAVLNPRYAQSITVYRKTGAWVAGRWTPNPDIVLTLQGTITVPSATDLAQVPEGDRQQGAITIYTTAPLQLTTSAGTSDEIEWRGSRYRVQHVWPYADYGYYKAVATKMDPTAGVSP